MDLAAAAAKKAARKAAKKAAKLLETPEEKGIRRAAKKLKKLQKEGKKKRKRKDDQETLNSGEVTPDQTPLPTKRAKVEQTKSPWVEPPSANVAATFLTTTAKTTTTTTTSTTTSTTEKPTLSENATPEEFRKFHEMEILGKDELQTGPYECPPPCKSFEASHWDKSIKAKLISAGFASPTPIQAQSWPICNQGRDMISVARTGSGKTLGFLLPAFEKIRLLEKKGVMGNGKNERACSPLCVVLAPTRELAMQIGVEATTYGRQAGIRSVTVYGGDSKYKQIRSMERLNPQIIIGTPGRLNDFCSMGKINLSRTCILVLDEADRMLDMGFEPQLNDIQTHMPRQTMGATRPLPSSGLCDQYSRQTLLFSATWPDSVKRVGARFTVNPVQLNVGSKSGLLLANEKIHQTVMVIEPQQKFEEARKIIKNLTPEDKCICFMATKKTCDTVANALWKEGVNCDSLHGDKEQWQRSRIINSFKSSQIRILFATDVAARGLDVKDISHVICYDFPKPKGLGGIEDFVHRIGRTARGGREGKAITFFTRENSRHAGNLVDLLERAKQEVPDDLRAMVRGRGGGGGGGRGGRRGGWGNRGRKGGGYSSSRRVGGRGGSRGGRGGRGGGGRGRW
jgi:ATP-dependent RNA helicase DDX5/DBP2